MTIQLICVRPVPVEGVWLSIVSFSGCTGSWAYLWHTASSYDYLYHTQRRISDLCETLYPQKPCDYAACVSVAVLALIVGSLRVVTATFTIQNDYISDTCVRQPTCRSFVIARSVFQVQWNTLLINAVYSSYYTNHLCTSSCACVWLHMWMCVCVRVTVYFTVLVYTISICLTCVDIVRTSKSWAG